MNKRERILKIFNRESTDRTGFWIGNPVDESKDAYSEYFGITEKCSGQNNFNTNAVLATKAGLIDIELAECFQSDCIWLSPEHDPNAWKHPENRPIFDVLQGRQRESLNQAGALADCESVSDLDAFSWPDCKHWNFESPIEVLKTARSKELAVFSGMWMPFFHTLCDLFGMDNYFMKMYTHPEVVTAATEKVMDFYLESNRLFLEQASDLVDVLFFGNDLGSQLDLLISPDAIKTFIMPYYARIVEQANRFNLKVMLHSCGAISKMIPSLIDVGIDALHPLQAKASHMNPEMLSKEYGKDLIFVGAVDTQDLLPFKTAQDVFDEVQRLKRILGPGFIVSPSHEALLPNVPIENVIAMRDAAVGNCVSPQ